MNLRWKLIVFEVILEVLMELAPVKLGILATVAQYLMDLSLESSKISNELVFTATIQQCDRQYYGSIASLNFRAIA